MTPDQQDWLPPASWRRPAARTFVFDSSQGLRSRDLRPVDRDRPAALGTQRGGHTAVRPIDQYRRGKINSLGNLSSSPVFSTHALIYR